MQTVSNATPVPALSRSTGCHGGAQPSQSPLKRWRIPLIAGGALIAGVALALTQGWLAGAALVPLLYALPCALMMFVCMRHMNHGERTDAAALPPTSPGERTTSSTTS